MENRNKATQGNPANDPARGSGGIKSDCTNASDYLTKTIGLLEYETEVASDDPESRYYNPDWEVSLEPEKVAKIIRLLTGAAGLLHHLGNNPEAVAELMRDHMAAEGQQ